MQNVRNYGSSVKPAARSVSRACQATAEGKNKLLAVAAALAT